MNLNKVKLGKVILASGLILALGCKNESNDGNGKDDPTSTVIKHTLNITAPTGGTLSSDAGGINCRSKGTTCKAEFSKGAEVTLTAKADTGYILGAWQGACDKANADQPCKLVMDADKTAGRAFLADTDGDEVPDIDDVDDDNDGLIEVHNLDMFDHIRHNLAGTSYKTSSSAADNRMGAPEAATDDCKTATMDGGKSFHLCGYELMRDLDFAQGDSYANGSVNTDWRPAGGDPDSAINAGFNDIDGFNAIFDGNGYKISNLYSRDITSSASSVGLFRSITADAATRNLGVANSYIYGGADQDFVGVLVGRNEGNITASYAIGSTVHGGAGEFDYVGGLVGWNKGNITASYAIRSNVNGGEDLADRVGALVGYNQGSIMASYVTGAANGGNGDDQIGGLVGVNGGSIIASYATSNVDDDDSNMTDRVGALVGVNQSAGIITFSYGFGSTAGGTANDLGGPPAGVTSASGLTADNADTDAGKNIWGDADSNTKGAWDFGTTSQPPALKYADYDGVGTDFDCKQFPACGSLLPEQRP